MNITENKRFITTTELANMLNTTNNVILNVAKKCGIEKEIKNGVATYWNEEEVSKIINNIDYDNSQSKQALTEIKGTIKTEIMLNEEFNRQIEKAKSLPRQEKLTLALTTFQSLLEDLQEDNRRKQQENEELKNWKTEKLYIENEKYQSKELRTKINKRIRQIARDTDSKHSDIWNKYFSIYSNIHCFSGKQSLDLIQDRHHLKEFYNLTLIH